MGRQWHQRWSRSYCRVSTLFGQKPSCCVPGSRAESHRSVCTTLTWGGDLAWWKSQSSLWKGLPSLPLPGQPLDQPGELARLPPGPAGARQVEGWDRAAHFLAAAFEGPGQTERRARDSGREPTQRDQ